jgi:hypothetical protein
MSMNNKREGIPYDGFGSVVEMLARADVGFREKILTNLRRRDPELVRRLEAHLRVAFTDDSRATLERSQRSHFTRGYGQ